MRGEGEESRLGGSFRTVFVSVNIRKEDFVASALEVLLEVQVIVRLGQVADIHLWLFASLFFLGLFAVFVVVVTGHIGLQEFTNFWECLHVHLIESLRGHARLLLLNGLLRHKQLLLGCLHVGDGSGLSLLHFVGVFARRRCANK